MRASTASAVLLVLGVAGCSENVPPTTPTVLTAAADILTPASPPGSAVTFGGLTEHEAAVDSYSEAGLTVKTSGASWIASTTYGNPRPFIAFWAQGGETAVGQADVTAAGGTFLFRSVDLYASTTPIPYKIDGLRDGVHVFSLTGTVPNTLGTFRTVENPRGDVAVDTLRIALTNAAAPCCRNPVGLDNLRFAH
jgi:hypothetical protein